MVGIIGAALKVLGCLVEWVVWLREDILPAQDEMPLHSLWTDQATLVIRTNLKKKKMSTN